MARTCLFHTLGRCAGSCPGASSRTPLPGTARLPGCSLTPHVCKPGESTDRSCDGRLHYSYCLRDKGPGYLCPCLGARFAESLQGTSTTHTSSSSTCRMLVRYFQVPPLLQAHSLLPSAFTTQLIGKFSHNVPVQGMPATPHWAGRSSRQQGAWGSRGTCGVQG